MTEAVPSTADKRHYRFDDFVVDPVRRLLVREGEAVPVTPKAFSILLLLLERRGEVLDKEELLRQVWPDTFVTEANLTQNVSSLRKALGERPGEHRYVVTVPGRGYTFVAEVSEIPAETFPFLSGSFPRVELPAARPEPAAATPRSRLGRPPAWVLLLAVLAAASGLTWFLLRSVPRPGESGVAAGAVEVRPSIAVLGFRDLSESPETEWLGAALSEMLTTELAAGGRVRVVSGETLARARLAAVPASLDTESMERLHGILGTDLLVVGAYLPLGGGAGRQIRVDLRVVRFPEGELAASLAEVGTEAELFDLVSRTGSRLRQALGFAELSSEQARAARALQPSSPEAARLYAEGLERLHAFETPAALKLLQEAAAADPESAPLRSALSQAWLALGYDHRAVEEARRAVELAQSLPRPERLVIEARFQAASRDWQRAAEIYHSLWTFFPDEPEHGLQLATCLSEAERGAEALAVVEALRRLPAPAGQDPRIDLKEAEVARRLADTPRMLRASRAAAQKARRSGEELIVAQALLPEGLALLISGQPEEAARLFQEARGLYEKAGHVWGVAAALAHIGLARHRQGDLDGAETVYLQALEMAQQVGNVAGIASQLGNLGFLYLSRGDASRALTYLERARTHFEEVEDPLQESRVLSGAAAILLSRGDLEAARSRIDESLRLSREVGSRADEARGTHNLATWLAWRGRLGEARGLHEQAFQVLRDHHHPGLAASALAAWGDDLFRLGDLAAARRKYEEALAMKRQAGDRIGAGEVLGALALLEEREGNPAASRAHFEEQLRIARETGARSLRASALHGLGRAELAAGNPAAARQALAAALAESTAAAEELTAMSVRIDLARLELAHGNPGEAVRLAAEAAGWWRQRGIPRGEALALAVQAEALARQGRGDDARNAAARVRALTARGEDRDLQSSVAPGLARAEAALSPT